MDITQLIEWGFQTVISIAAWSGIKSINNLKDSVDDLNQKVAVALTQDQHHSLEIKEIKERLTFLEQQR